MTPAPDSQKPAAPLPEWKPGAEEAEHGLKYTPVAMPTPTEADEKAAWELLGRYPGNQGPTIRYFGGECIALGRFLVRHAPPPPVPHTGTELRAAIEAEIIKYVTVQTPFMETVIDRILALLAPAPATATGEVREKLRVIVADFYDSTNRTSLECVDQILAALDGDKEDAILAFATAQWGEKDLAGIGLKLGEEAGEIAGALVKIPEGRATNDDLDKELGDILVVLSQLAAKRGTSLLALRQKRFEQIKQRAAARGQDGAERGTEK